MKRQGHNTRNKQNPLYKALTRLFSGPITKRRRQFYRRERRIDLQKYDFDSASGMPFKKHVQDMFMHTSTKYVFEQQRSQRYTDFDMMTYEPILGTALDIYATEITACNELEKILKIDCRNQEIKSILDEFYYNVLNVEANLYHWARTMCKYGDFFLYLDIDENKGITHVIGLPTREVERMEGQDPKNPKYVQFQWNSGGLTFEDWQICHFRILGDDRFAPYGQCKKFDTRILTTSGIKEIQHIEEGDEVFVFDIEKQKKTPAKVLKQVCSGEKECLEIRTRHNFIEPTYEHPVLTWNKKEKEFLYKKAQDIQIGDLLVLDKKQKFDEKIKIDKTKPEHNKNGWWNASKNIPEFVDEEFARLFGFLLGDGWIPKHNNQVCFALGVDDELNQHYIDILEKYTEREGKFRQHHEPKHTNLKHSQVNFHSKMLKTILQRMGFVGNVYTKRFPEWIYRCSDEIKKAFLQGLYDADGSVFVDRWDCARFSLELANEQMIKDAKVLIQSLGYKSGKICTRHRKKATIIGNRSIDSKRSWYFYYFQSKLKQAKVHDNKKHRLTDEYILEPVVSIKENGKHKVYDIQVDNENHNFYANGIVVHNSVFESARRVFRQYDLLKNAMMSYRVVRSPERRVFYLDVGNMPPEEIEQFVLKFRDELRSNQILDESTGNVDLRYDAFSVENDYIIPVRGQSQTRVEPLPGGQFTGDVDDVKFLRDEMMAAIKIPAAYIIPEGGATEDKTSLAQKDILFAKTVQMIQRSVVNELEKMGVIHLYTLGFRKDDLISFKLSLSNPSKLAALQELEHWRTKFDVASSATEGYFSKRWVAVNFFGLSEEEFIRNQREIYNDKKYEAQLEEAISGEGIPEEGEFGLQGGGPLAEPPMGEEELMVQPPEGEAPEDMGDDTLLAQPEEPAKRDDGSRKIKVKKGLFGKESHETEGSKGKRYSPVKHDKRTSSGPRKHQWDSMSGNGSSKNNKYNRPSTAFKELVSLGKGITESFKKEEQEIEEINNGLYQIIESLEFNKSKSVVDDQPTQEQEKTADESKTQQEA